MNEEIKGKGAVGIAIAYYAMKGMASIPLEPCEYNLIFDNGDTLQKIKVVSCSFKTEYGIYAASIRTSGGNQPKNKVKKFDQTECDIVFVVTSSLEIYEIPSKEIESSRQISLKKYEKYQVKLMPS